MTKLLTIRDVSDRLCTPVSTLRDWRQRGYGPPSVLMRGRVMYRETDVDAFVEALFAAEKDRQPAVTG